MSRVIVRTFLLICVAISSVSSRADTTMTRPVAQETFKAGNTAYEQQRYEDARAAYKQLVDGGITSPEVFYNLANASARVGRRGEAVAYYHRALKYKPRDEDALANLQRIAPQSVNRFHAVPAWLSRVVNSLSTSDWAMFALVAFYAFGISGALYCAAKQDASRRRWRIPVRISIFLLLLIGPLAGFRYYSDYIVRHYAVIEDGASVRSGPADRFAQIAVEPAGRLVRRLDHADNGWMAVKLSDGRKGYIREKDVLVI